MSVTSTAPVALLIEGAGLIGASVSLGLRHGVDWDHLAAITDITSSATSRATHDAQPHPTRRGMWLATMYALGHCAIVAAVGMAAITLHAFLPGWVDPLMERVVGVTLLLLGVWVFSSLWQCRASGGGTFQLRKPLDGRLRGSEGGMAAIARAVAGGAVRAARR